MLNLEWAFQKKLKGFIQYFYFSKVFQNYLIATQSKDSKSRIKMSKANSVQLN